MAYTINDENGFVGLGPSISGLKQLRVFIASQNKEHPALDHFLEEGYTTQTLALSTECKRLARVAIDNDVKITLTSLAKDAKRARGIVILAD